MQPFAISLSNNELILELSGGIESTMTKSCHSKGHCPGAIDLVAHTGVKIFYSYNC